MSEQIYAVTRLCTEDHDDQMLVCDSCLHKVADVVRDSAFEQAAKVCEEKAKEYEHLCWCGHEDGCHACAEGIRELKKEG